MQFIVYRTGYNKANNPISECGPETAPLARVEAASAEEAVALALKRFSCYANQSLHARPAEEADAEEAEIDRRVSPF